MSWINLSKRWKSYFIESLHNTARMSKDEDTKVGALIIDTEFKIIVSSGWNDLPRGVKHTKERNSRPLKYIYTSHAERNCMDNALLLEANVKGKTLICTLGCCPQCCCSIVNSGIKEVVTPPLDFNHTSCGDLYQHSVEILKEAGVKWCFDEKLSVLG